MKYASSGSLVGRISVLLAALAIASTGMAQDSTLELIGALYGPVAESVQGVDEGGTELTAAIVPGKRAANLIIVSRQANDVPITVFNMHRAFAELDIPLRDPATGDAFSVDHVALVGVGERRPWILARATCNCSAEVFYMAITPNHFPGRFEMVAARVNTLLGPHQVVETMLEPSPTRSVLGLALADGLAELGDASSDQPLEILEFWGRQAPDATGDCLSCLLPTGIVSPVDVALAREVGVQIPESRREFRYGENKYVAVTAWGFERWKESLVYLETPHDATAVYRYSHDWNPPPDPRDALFLAFIDLRDVTQDGVPELFAIEICNCGLDAYRYAVVDLANGDVVSIELGAGPSFGGGGIRKPYIRSLSSISPTQELMQSYLVDYLIGLEHPGTLDPGDAMPLGLVNQVELSNFL